MIWIVYGAAGALGVLCLLGAGFAAGWTARRLWKENCGFRQEISGGEEAVQAALAEQRAFEGMLHYNAETAYGAASPYPDLMGGEG